MSPFLQKQYKERKEKKNLIINIILLAVFIFFFASAIVITNLNRDTIEDLIVLREKTNNLKIENETLSLKFSQALELSKLEKRAKELSYLPLSSIIWLKLQPEILVKSGLLSNEKQF